MTSSNIELARQIAECKSPKSYEIENQINLIMNSARSLYWDVLDCDDSQKQNIYLGVLETASNYLDLSYEELNKRSKNYELNFNFLHNLRNKRNKVKKVTMAYGVVVPIIPLSELKVAWNNFLEVQTWKVFFALLASFFALIFGGLNILDWVLLVMTIGHFIMRFAANRYKGANDYVTFSRSIQLFLWTYFLLAIGTTLSYIIVLNGLPKGTFICLFKCWLIWGELKGIEQNARIAKFPIPPILEHLLNSSHKGGTPFN